MKNSIINVNRQPWMSDEVYEWAIREENARVRTANRLAQNGTKALIMVKAQHPLNPDGTPGPEYEQRLLKAMSVKGELENRGLEVYFMTFGGIHEGHETISLAEAGLNWLMQHGVGKNKIKVCSTVFSGNDEDRLAAEEFEKLGNDFRELHAVMSIGQFERSRLYYIFMGWAPEFHLVTYLSGTPHHSTICELWGDWAVPSFKKGVESIEEMTESIRKRHIDAATPS